MRSSEIVSAIEKQSRDVVLCTSHTHCVLPVQYDEAIGKFNDRLGSRAGCCGADKDVDPDNEPAKFDPSFKGPLENRSCRDVIWILIFAAFWVGMVRCKVLF
jgi:hypothetical protein